MFTRKGDDLWMTKELTLYQALKGYSFTIKQLDGSLLTLQHSGVTQPNQVSTLPQRGMTRRNQTTKGNLVVTFTVKLPQVPDTIVNQLKDFV